MGAPSATQLAIFSDHLRHERRLSAHTSAGYRRDLQKFAAWTCANGVAQLNDIDSQHIRGCLAFLHRGGLGPASLQRWLSSLRTFFRFAQRLNWTTANPASGVRAPKRPRKLPATLDVDQVGQLLAITGDRPLDVRDRAVLELLYSSGLRLAELVALDLGDLDLREGTVRVVGKGKKTRLVPVGKAARSALAQWLSQRGLNTRADVPAVFTNRYGERLGPRTIQRRLQRLGIGQGVHAPVHPHLMRHCFASHLLESSGDLRAVQELLGHANLTTTQIYTHLDFQHLARVYDTAHPRAQRIKRPQDER